MLTPPNTQPPRHPEGKRDASWVDYAVRWGSALVLGMAMLTLWAFWRWWTSPLSPYLEDGAPPQGPTPPLWQTPDPSAVLPTALPNAPLPPVPWDGQSRVNLLLMGVDTRVWDKRWGAPRADTLLLLTLDPQRKTAGVLSLPRDLWVEIPGYGWDKINRAYPVGEASLGAWGGPLLTVRTVERLLDVEIPYFAVVDFHAFVVFVDAIEGVVVDVPAPIVVGIERPEGRKMVRLKPGLQTLNGELALAYARNRAKPLGSLSGDFARMRRQQQVLYGVVQRLRTPRIWGRLVLQAPYLLRELGSGFRTNVRPQDALAWGHLVTQIPESSMVFLEVTEQQAQARMVQASYGRTYALLPDPQALRALRDSLFAGSPAQQTVTPSTSPSLLPPLVITPTVAPREAPTVASAPPATLAAVRGEAPTVVVANATLYEGLACRTARWLTAQGFTVVAVEPASRLLAASELEVYANKPNSLAFLREAFGLQSSDAAARVHYPPVETAPADFRVLLGEDWLGRQPLPEGTACP